VTAHSAIGPALVAASGAGRPAVTIDWNAIAQHAGWRPSSHRRWARDPAC